MSLLNATLCNPFQMGLPMSHLSLAATSQLIDDLGFKGEMTAHGARSIARTMLVETLGYPEAIVEMQLSHAPRDAHGRAYNRTTWRVERHEMMRTWAEWLDGVRLGATVLPMAAE